MWIPVVGVIAWVYIAMQSEDYQISITEFTLCGVWFLVQFFFFIWLI